jgi:hypothetical protein
MLRHAKYDGRNDRMADAPVAQPDDTKEDGNDEGDVVMRYNEYNNNVPTQPMGEFLLAGSSPACNRSHPRIFSLSVKQSSRSLGRVSPIFGLSMDCFAAASETSP